jgi:hypothetical protein
VKMEKFSYDILCLWVLFTEHFKQIYSDDDARYGISAIKGDLIHLFRQLLSEEVDMTSEQRV